MITWQWMEHPIGYPTDPDDHDFESPRTPATISLGIRYEKDDVLLRHAVTISNRTIKNLSADEKNQMRDMLTDWLDNKLKKPNLYLFGEQLIEKSPNADDVFKKEQV